MLVQWGTFSNKGSWLLHNPPCNPNHTTAAKLATKIYCHHAVCQCFLKWPTWVDQTSSGIETLLLQIITRRGKWQIFVQLTAFGALCLWGTCICPGGTNTRIRHSPYRYTDSSRLDSYSRTDTLRRIRNQLERKTGTSINTNYSPPISLLTAIARSFVGHIS